MNHNFTHNKKLTKKFFQTSLKLASALGLISLSSHAMDTRDHDHQNAPSNTIFCHEENHEQSYIKQCYKYFFQSTIEGIEQGLQAIASDRNACNEEEGEKSLPSDPITSSISQVIKVANEQKVISLEQKSDTEKLIQTPGDVRIFNSATEMLDLAEQLSILTNQKKYDTVFSLVPTSFRKTFDSLSKEDFEYYTFWTNYSLAEAYMDLGKKETLNPEKASEYYTEAANKLNKYLLLFGTAVSQAPDLNQCMKDNCIFAYSTCGGIYTYLFKLNLSSDTNTNDQRREVLLDYLKKSTICFEKVLLYSDKLSNVLDPKKLNTIKLCLFHNYLSLNEYCLLSQKESFLKKAQEIHLEFRENRQKGALDLFEITKKALQSLEDQDNNHLPIHCRSESKQIKEIGDNHSFCHSSNYVMPPKFEVNNIFNHLCIISHKEDVSEILNTILNLENITKNHLISAKSTAQLFDIYQQMEIFLGFDAIHTDLKIIMINAFLKTENQQKALERICIMADLEENKNGKLSPLTLHYRAYLKNLCGDHEEWLAFEDKMTQTKAKKIEEMTQAKAKIIEEKKAKKLNQEKLRGELICEWKNTIKINEKKSKHHLQPPQSNSKKKDASSPSHVSSEADMSTFDDSFSSKSASEERKERLKRHEEAEKQRNEKKQTVVESSATSSTHIPSEVVVTTATSTTTPVEPLIKDFYDLTKSANDVDVEIENWTWKFTREELMNYFEVMGCKSIEGGSHKKVGLPKAILVKHGDTVITVLNDLGGALTLPPWDKSHNNGCVPNYLRVQIMEARKKLIQLGLKASKLS